MANTDTLKNGIQLYSTLLSLNGIIILVSQFAILRWIASWNPFNVVLVNLLIGISFLSLVHSTSYTLLLLFIVLYSLGELLIGARFDTLVDELATEESKGLYFGCSESVKIGTICGPVIGTLLLEQFGLQSGLPVFGLLCLITITWAGLLHLAKMKHFRGETRT